MKSLILMSSFQTNVSDRPTRPLPISNDPASRSGLAPFEEMRRRLTLLQSNIRQLRDSGDALLSAQAPSAHEAHRDALHLKERLRSLECAARDVRAVLDRMSRTDRDVSTS